MKIVKAPSTTAKPLSIRLSFLALTAALLITAGCNPKTPAPTTANPAASTTENAAPGQSPVNIKPEANEGAEPAHTWTTDQILTCTVSQCWHLANKSEDQFFDIVQELAATSAKNRDITLPQTEEAGQKAGEIIKSKAKADHDQLLYAIVDDAVRQIGKSAPAK